MIYHVPKANDDDVKIELNFLRRKYHNKSSYSIQEVAGSIPRFTYVNPSMTIFEIKKQLVGQLRGIFKEDPLAAHEAVLNDLIEVQYSLRNVRKEKHGKLAKCEICKKRHGSTDDFCELEIDDIEINESAENAK